MLIFTKNIVTLQPPLTGNLLGPAMTNLNSIHLPTHASRTFALGLVLLLNVGACSYLMPNQTPNQGSVTVEERSESAEDIRSNSGAGSRNDVLGVPEADVQQSQSAASDGATLALLESSTNAQAQGNITEAISYVERAIRLEPRRADLWIQLARLQLADDRIQDAEDYAQKALALAGDRVDLQRDAWMVLADSKDKRGLSEEAEAIRRYWRTERG